MSIIGTILQQPTELLDYDIDYTGFFSSIEYLVDDAISTIPGQCTAVVTPDMGVNCQVVRASDKVLKIILNNVSPDIEYKITVKMVSERNRIKEDELILVGIDF
tara:strand:- start:191 stop:502 length:312 start_codon:yes stop_codon:yes gene_type:complete